MAARVSSVEMVMWLWSTIRNASSPDRLPERLEPEGDGRTLVGRQTVQLIFDALQFVAINVKIVLVYQ